MYPDTKEFIKTGTESSLYSRRLARNIMLLAAGTVLSPQRCERLSNLVSSHVDWEYLLYLTELHSISPLVAHTFIVNGLIKKIPEPYAARFTQKYHLNLSRNILLADELSKVLSAFYRQGIPIITLKGTILAEQLYDNPGLRTISDIDILVPADYLQSAGILLQELEYQQSPLYVNWEHPFHEAPYTKRGKYPFVIELHRELDDPGLLTIPYEEIWSHAKEIKTQSATTLVLSPEDTLLYLANNYSKPSNQILKALCDIVQLLKKYQDSLDWEYFVRSTRQWKIETAVFYALKQAHDILGAPVPVSVIKEFRPEHWRHTMIQLLGSQETMISPIRYEKPRNEQQVLVRSLMMKRFRGTLEVLARYRDYRKRARCLRSGIWVVLVLLIAIGRKTSCFTRRVDYLTD